MNKNNNFIQNGLCVARSNAKRQNKEYNAEMLNRIQRAILDLRQGEGMNSLLELKIVSHKAGEKKARVRQNFPAGENSITRASQKALLDVFSEAIKDKDFKDAVASGLRALFQPNKTLASVRKGADMPTRTEYALYTFAIEFWETLFTALCPAIDAYLERTEPHWKELNRYAKEFAYHVFAAVFEAIVGMILKDYQKQQAHIIVYIPYQEYAELFELFIHVLSRAMVDRSFREDTLFERLIARICGDWKSFYYKNNGQSSQE